MCLCAHRHAHTAPSLRRSTSSQAQVPVTTLPFPICRRLSPAIRAPDIAACTPLGATREGPSTAALGRSRQACLTRVRHPWRTRSSPKQAAPKRFDDVAATCRALPGPPPFTRSPDSSLRRLRVGARCPLLLLRGVEAGLLGRPPLGGPAFRATSYTPPWPLSRRRVVSSEVDGCRMASRRATSLLSLSCAACSHKHRRRGRRRHLSRGVRQGRS